MRRNQREEFIDHLLQSTLQKIHERTSSSVSTWLSETKLDVASPEDKFSGGSDAFQTIANGMRRWYAPKIQNELHQ